MDFAKTLDELIGSADKAADVYGKVKKVDAGIFDTNTTPPISTQEPTYTAAAQEVAPAVQVQKPIDKKILYIMGGLLLFFLLK